MVGSMCIHGQIDMTLGRAAALVSAVHGVKNAKGLSVFAVLPNTVLQSLYVPSLYLRGWPGQ